MSKKRLPTESELDLWRRFTTDVRPISPRKREDAPKQKSPRRSAVTIKNGKIALAPKAKGQGAKPTNRPRNLALDPSGPVDIDRKNWERLKRGQMRIEKTLDLHGQTQTEAHASLNRFLTMAATAGLRCVLVVTGKGGGEGKGILRQMAPRWLGEAGNVDKILTYSPAQPRHGGDGALYILLRKRRS